MDNAQYPQNLPQAGESAPSAPTVGATMNAAQCAALLFCSQTMVEELALKGELPATKFGRSWVFVTDQIVELLRQQCEQGAAKRRAECEAKLTAAPTVDRLLMIAPAARRKPGRQRRALPQLG